MIYRSTQLTRVVEVRLEAGELLLDAILELARREWIDAAWVRGHGVLEYAELEEAGARVALEGPLELATLAGAVHVGSDRAEARLHAVVARPGAAGRELHAGRLLAARAGLVELVLDVLDGSALEWSFDPSTGRRR